MSYLAEEFYRINDDSDECLLDIVSADEVVYILDESDSDSEDLEKHQELKNGLDTTSSSVINGIFAASAAETTSNKSVIKIPTSHTSQHIASKEKSKSTSRDIEFTQHMYLIFGQLILFQFY